MMMPGTCASSGWRYVRMGGMQEDFILGVRELHKAGRPHTNYVKDFERRAQKDPKGCAEEALQEITAGATWLLRAFKQAFGEGFEEAFARVFYLTPDRQYAMRKDVVLPDKPQTRELFLVSMYWLHFYRLTLGFFERCLKLPGNPTEAYARAMCECFVRHEHA